MHLAILNMSEINFECEQFMDGGKDKCNVGMCKSMSQRVGIGLSKPRVNYKCD